MKYLIVKCEELNDQYECDANRIPICILDDYEKYNRFGYEIYAIKDNGSLKLIKNYETASEEYISVCIWKNDNPEESAPEKIIDICKGNRDNISKTKIAQIKKDFGFYDDIKEITIDMKCCGQHGELINNKWIVLGERIDDIYPLGY